MALDFGYQFFQQSVTASLTIAAKDDDSFFAPVLYRHTGFAADGFYYNQGVVTTQQASWFTEPVSVQRGPGQAFPSYVLVLLSQASLSLMDLSNNTVAMWMLFYYLDQGAFPNNFTQTVSSFSPQSLAWGNGRLSVVSSGDPGSPYAGVYSVLTLDFTTDQSYVDCALIP